MPGFRDKRFTIYDLMDRNGAFRANPANAGAEDANGATLYVGPVKYPLMLYHPKGEEEVIVPAETIVTPYGPQKVNQQTQIRYIIVQNEEEEKRYRAEGWHSHPAHAMAAGGRDAPAISSDQRTKDLEAEIARMQAEIKGAEIASSKPRTKPASPA